MRGDRIPTKLLCRQLIPSADPALLARLEVPAGHRSLGIVTTDCDDVSYAALDEATKAAAVEVVYARSMYAGAQNASTALAGEFIGILSGPDPETVRSGLEAAAAYLEEASFRTANDAGDVVYFARCISRTGAYLSRQAGVAAGTPMAYLIAPPAEALVGLDAAMKAAAVELRVFCGPPSETNFAGGLLTGDQAACRAACEAFAQAVCEVAQRPLGG